MRNSKKLFRLICLTLTAVMLFSLTGCFSYGGYDYYGDLDYDSDSDDSSVDPDADFAALFEDDYDAEEYFQNNATVISAINAADSADIHNEADAYQNLTDRGLSDSGITADFDMNGEILEDAVITDTSSDSHPSYTTYYETSAGDLWSINEINGVVMAMPVSYNIDREVPVIITETGTVMSYDLYSNKFYETIPNETEMIVKTVDRIDAETLENLTAGAIDAL